MRFVVLAISLSAAAPAWAEVPATCPAELAHVDDSFAETLARLAKAGDADQTEKCAALRHHIEVLSAARDVFLHCLTGHDLGENVGQMDGSIEDFRVILANQHCQ